MGKHLGADTKCKILMARTKGMNPYAISKEIKRLVKTIENFIKRYDLRGTIKNNYQANKPKAIDNKTARNICRIAFQN